METTRSSRGWPRMTLQTQLILGALLQDPTEPRYGLELRDLVGLPTGTIYPILARLEQARWVTSEWETHGSERTEGRPPRRYRLSPNGAVLARQALADADARRGVRPLWTLPSRLAGEGL